MIATVWLPQDISAHGEGIDRLITFLHYFMLALFVGWGIYFAYCLIRFRARAGRMAQYAEVKARPSKFAEVVVVGIEAFLLIGLAMPVWAYYRSEPPTKEDHPLEVRVVAQQFAWNVHYPGPDGTFGRTAPALIDEQTNPIGLDESDPAGADDVVTINNFHIPKGRDVVVRLTSKDVIHSFSVPLLRVKQDAIPGMEIPIWFKATRTNDDVRRQMSRAYALPRTEAGVQAFVRRHRRDIAMADAGRADGGAPIVAAGRGITEDVVHDLLIGNVAEIELAPRDPVNIQCAQLCGLGHYRMLGQMRIHEPAAFEKWYAQAGAVEEFVEDEEDEEDDDD